MGATTSATRKPVTITTLQSMYRKNEPITMVTAHDFPSALVADQAGMDMILVGDSLAMVALGMEDTGEVLMEEMLLHCKSVARATKGAFTVLLSIAPLYLSFLTRSHRSATSPWAPTRSRPRKPSPPPSRWSNPGASKP
jgi:hypothetical protein